MDYKALNGTATALIKSAGFAIEVKRGDSSVGKGFGVFSPSKKSMEQGATPASPLSIASKTMYVTATQTFNPEVGDLVIAAKLGTQWQIVEVEDYKPATTTIAFRLQVQ